MDKDILIKNIEAAAFRAGSKPTPICIAAGVGRQFLSDLRRNKIPSVAKVADLAAYLGVTTSDLVGDAQTPAELQPLAEAWAELNEEGRERLISYAEDLTASGRYKKHDPDELGQEGGAVG